MNKQFVALTLALALLAGCAQLPVYQKPAGNLGLRDRQLLYDRFSADLTFWDGFTVGGRAMPQWGTPSQTFSKYSLASGDPASAARARKSEIYNWSGLVAGMTGLFCGIAFADRSSQSVFVLSILPYAAAGISAELILIEFGRTLHFKPAVKSFNQFLRRDLGLEPPQP